MSCFYILFCLISCVIFAQNKEEDFAIEAVRQTLPEYLDQNPNSPVAHLRNGKNYNVLKSFMERAVRIMPEGERNRLQADLAQLDKTADSIAEQITGKKIAVFIEENWHGYRHVTDSIPWEITYRDLRETFETNSQVILDTVLDIAYIGLIKKQIDARLATVPLDFTTLENPRYAFTYKPVTDGELYVKGKRLYRPVFNRERTKGCYLFSYACSTGYCRDFIFISFENGKWRYVDNYPSHLIEGKSDE